MEWQGVKEGWRPGEQVILMLGFLTPILVPIFTKLLNFQITPLVLALLLAMALKEKKAGSVGDPPD